MNIDKANVILMELCHYGKELDRARKNNTPITFKSDCTIKFVSRFKMLINECLKSFGVSKILFYKQMFSNQIYVGCLFKLKDQLYRLRSSSLYHCYNDILRIEIMPICEVYDSKSKKIEYQSIWRRAKYYDLACDFETFKSAKLPRGQKCRLHDIVVLKDRWHDTRTFVKITGITVCGPIYYSVAYLDGSKQTGSYITEGRLTRIKNGI